MGAGLSGLAAAGDLVSAGHDVRVVEARNRVGGRVMTLEPEEGGRFDLGATWIWGGQPASSARGRPTRRSTTSGTGRQPNTCEDEHRHVPVVDYGHPWFRPANVGGRLGWAWTETAEHGGGHLEGAIVTGRRAARLVGSGT